MQNEKTTSSLMARAASGIQSFFNRVYGYMAGGLVVSGIVAYLATQPPFIGLFYKINATGQATYSVLGYVAILSPLLLVWLISSSARDNNAGKAQSLFWLFSGLMGISLSNIFLLFSGAAIFQTFLISAASFLGLSLFGYTTKKDLSAWGRFLFMALMGLIVAMLVNLFVRSSEFNFALNALGVLVFAGLTAYDTQKLKVMYDMTHGEEAVKSLAIVGALNLYLDFINLFTSLLTIMNDRR